MAEDSAPQTAVPDDGQTVVDYPPTSLAELAWSHEGATTDPIVQQSWRSTWGNAAVLILVGVVVAVVIAIVGLVSMKMGRDSVPPLPDAARVQSSSIAPPPMAPALPPPPSAALTQTAQPLLSADDRFNKGLEARGWTTFDRQASLNTAHWICSQHQLGTSPAEIRRTLMAVNKGSTPDNASEFMEVAESVYCPDFLGR